MFGMNHLTHGLTLGFVALSAISFGQIPTLHFTSYEVSNFDAVGVSNSGTLIGFTAGGETALWSPSLGMKVVPKLSGDVYQAKVSDSGNIYGVSAGRVIGWNATGGRTELASQAGISFSLIASSDNDILLLKGTATKEAKYYTFKAGSGLHSVQLSNSKFIPTMVNFDGSVYGTISSGTNAVGIRGFMFAKLNDDGTTTVAPQSVLAFSSLKDSLSQGFVFQPNGAMVVRCDTCNLGGRQVNTTRTQDIYSNNGSHYRLNGSKSSGGNSSAFGGGNALSILANGSAFGMSGSSVSAPTKMYFDLAHPAGVALGNSNFDQGSAIPDQFVLGNGAFLVGKSESNGHVTYSIAKIQ